MKNRSIFNDEHKLAEGEWILTLTRRNNSSHAFLILEGLDAKEEPIRKRAELAFKEIAPGKYDPLRTQIYCYDLSGDKLELMRRDQGDYVCRTFILNLSEKQRFDDKIEADQSREFRYNLGGHTKISGFLGTSLASSGSEGARASSVAAAERKVAEGGGPSKASGHASLATLEDGHNCLSWAEEAIRYVNPALDPRGKFAKFVIAVPQIELTTCIIL
jgi:hypothetical protein